MSNPNPSQLPPVVRELVRAIGGPAAFHLLERRGGQRIYLPKVAKADNLLLQDMTFDALEKLVEQFGTCLIDLPKFDSVLRQARHDQVRAMRADGEGIDDIVQASGYTRRQVFYILAAGEVPAERSLAHLQMDMFGGADPEAAERPESTSFSANNPFNLGRKIG